MFFKNKNGKIEEKESELVFLRTAHSEYELSLITAVLDDSKIQYTTSKRSIDGYLKVMTGATRESVDVLVKKSDFSKAKELIDSIVTTVDKC